MLRPGDEQLHYSDGSHRWVCPDPDDDQVAWTWRVRQHVRAHQAQPNAGRNPSRRREPEQPQ